MYISDREEEIEHIHGIIAGQNIRSLAITGAEGKEGVTTLAYTLASRNLLAGRTTLLVDLNLYNPKLQPLMPDLSSDLNLLEEPENKKKDNLNLPSIVSLDEGSTALTGVCAPVQWSTILKLCEPGILEQQISFWHKNYDTVIIDTSPLLKYCNNNIPAERVAAACDACIFVALAKKTNENMAAECSKKLRDAGATIIGCVINDQYAPNLKTELLREIKRFNSRIPILTNKFQYWIENNRLLSLKV